MLKVDFITRIATIFLVYLRNKRHV